MQEAPRNIPSRTIARSSASSTDWAMTKQCWEAVFPPWPFLDLQMRVSLLSGCRNFCCVLRQFALLWHAPSTFATLSSTPLVVTDGNKGTTFPTRTAIDVLRWHLVGMSTAIHFSSYMEMIQPMHVTHTTSTWVANSIYLVLWYLWHLVCNFVDETVNDSLTVSSRCQLTTRMWRSIQAEWGHVAGYKVPACLFSHIAEPCKLWKFTVTLDVNNLCVL